MPFSLSSDRGVLRIVLVGTLTPGDLERLADALMEVEAAASVCPPRITDLTGLTRFEVGFDELFEMAQRRRDQPPANPIRSALVAAAPVQLGFARMFQTLNDHPLITLRIFPDADAAVAWLMDDGD